MSPNFDSRETRTRYNPNTRASSRTRTDETTSEDDPPSDYRNYKPPLRLLAFELTALILLICLIVPEPIGMAAISGAGSTTIGLLRGCDGSCTSWLGAGGGTGSSSNPVSSSSAETDSSPVGVAGTTRDLLKRAPAGDNSGFFLRTGLATICAFFLLLYAFIFHLIRQFYAQPIPEEEDDFDPNDAKARRTGVMWCCVPCLKNKDLSWVKRFGYRVSRVFTLTNVLLLGVICIDAGRVAGIGGIGTGFYLLLITTFLIVYIALLEFLREDGRIRGWLLFGHKFGASCRGRGKDGQPETQTRRMSYMEQGRSGGGGGARTNVSRATESTVQIDRGRLGRADAG